MCLCLVAVAARGVVAAVHVVGVVVGIGQPGDFVVVPGGVEGEVPREVVGHDRLGVDAELHAVVLQRTDVLDEAGAEVGAHGNLHLVDEVLGLAVVSVEAAGDASVEEAEVESGVPRGGLLPLQVLVVGVGAQGVVTLVTEEVLRVLVADVISRQVREVLVHDRLLPGDTPAQTELQVGEGLDVAQEAFLLHLPCKGCRGELAPAVVVRETGGTVEAHREGEQVSVEERVVQTAEVGHQGVVGAVCLLAALLLLVLLLEVAVPAGALRVAGAVEVLFLAADHHVERVVAQLLDILGVGIERRAVLELRLHAVPSVVVVAVGVGRDDGALRALCIFTT